MSTTPPSPTPGHFWDQRYAEPGYAFGEAPNAWLASLSSRFTKGMRALVPGDGEGRNGVFLAELGLDVATIDASVIGVRKAKELAAKRGVAIDAQVADLTAWAWPKGEFDLVVSIFLHWPSNMRKHLHTQMLEALKPGGYLVLEAYTPRQLVHRATGSVGGPTDPDMLFEPSELARDFAALKIDRIEEIEAALQEGSRHTGKSSVVRMLAQRPART